MEKKREKNKMMIVVIKNKNLVITLSYEIKW